ncbi:tyrosine recombinase XerC [Microlunatus sp. Gsoil 973]|uniref:site-specific integrase n=1 Tax=Microlunatus sp. Gsoil 973 TaxID=2672569 RepID=UPI001E59A415|nr:tyrosine-type recombinase/integrase [Microlunatus sp. Gsoil 973]
MLRDLEDDVHPGKPNYTVAEAMEDWLTYGLGRQGPPTIKKYRSLSATHIVPFLGKRKLRELTATQVELWLANRAQVLSSEPLRRVHACLNRAVRRAMALDLVKRNVVELVEIPRGKREGRQSKSLTPEQADQILARTANDRMHAYIVLSLLTGGRTEELRGLRWEHVHLDPTRAGDEKIGPYIEVWHSVRRGGDTKTRRSRRTLALPQRCVGVLRKRRADQERERLLAGDQWHNSCLVFTTGLGTEMDSANVRRDFRHALRLVPGVDPNEWTPRDLRHSFVSLLSDAGVPIEEISRLVGHSGTTVTELVYRHQLRPVVQTGATIMDQLFGSDAEGPEPLSSASSSRVEPDDE